MNESILSPNRKSNTSERSRIKSPLKKINFNRDESSIKTTALDGSMLTIQINIDLMELKIFALLMCKGTVRYKAGILFDIAVGPEKVNDEDATISWTSSRLIKAFKQLIFYSEIFPKKYQNEFLEELDFA